MQTILGSGGAIGTVLAAFLPDYTDKLRLVSRSPIRVNPTDELYVADLRSPDATMKAVEGSQVVYLTIGLPYNTQIWMETWPVVMKNVLDACEAQKSRLVFFDNVYMYDPEALQDMDETTVCRPVSKKGTVRAHIARMLMEAVEQGRLEALIIRAADFYGPSIPNVSVLTEMVFNNLAENKKANWLGSPHYQHSFTYVPDAGKATAYLGNSDAAYNQVWHAPTAAHPPTGLEWIQNIAAEMGVPAKFRNVSKSMVKIMKIFNPMMKELDEMMYQYDRPYVFNSQKIETQFGLQPTSYQDGIKHIIKSDYANLHDHHSGHAIKS